MNFFEENASIYWTIALAALGTYALRLGGLFLAEKIPTTGRFKVFMETLPGTILLSLVVPGMVSSGIWGGLACSATFFCVYKTRNVLLAAIVGMGIVILSRYF